MITKQEFDLLVQVCGLGLEFAEKQHLRVYNQETSVCYSAKILVTKVENLLLKIQTALKGEQIDKTYKNK